MAAILDEAGTGLLDEALGQILDEAGSAIIVAARSTPTVTDPRDGTSSVAARVMSTATVS